ncbi:MAG: peptidoglycan DD-metalloendopeptidase family protein [Rhodobacteraceae bacterium]|nr:peptidoglycan DD-metalloendopeptidase family protein [Paracoccaceae bacterium]
MILRFALSITLLWAGVGVSAQNDHAEAAIAAADMLEKATMALEDAQNPRDRVRALTEIVRSYEAGLEAVRDGLRRAATREAQVSRRLEAREDEIADLLGILQTIETAPPPVLLLHPSGPIGSARSSMMLAEVTPALNVKAQNLRNDLKEIQTLRLLQQNAAENLENGLAGVQTARAELSQAVADRTDLPKRFVEDPVRVAILISSVETLGGFASGLAEVTQTDIPAAQQDLPALKGLVRLPVRGLILHHAGEADAAGIKREGIIIATRPRALVTAPTAATIRYRGPLLDLGNVMILEPVPGVLFVLSGLQDVFGDAGQVIPEGAPIGLMGGSAPESGAILSTSSDGTGGGRSETLYIEVREGGSPVDPESWFQTDKDGQ